MTYDILVLHGLGDRTKTRRTSLNHALCYERYAPGQRYLYHDVAVPPTRAMRRIPFQAVILDTTFLRWRWRRAAVFQHYQFLRDLDAVKIALPQDDYDFTDVLDGFLDDIEADVVYTPIQEHWEVLYPRTIKKAEIRLGLTGYVDDEDVGRLDHIAKPFADRTVDVGCRVKHLPPSRGRFGQLKGEFAHRFAAAAKGGDLSLDISTRPEDVLVGPRWLEFLGDSRYTLGSLGGCSILDRDGEIQHRVKRYLGENPEAAFEEVEAACFPGQDGRYDFPAISPRLFEVAMARSCQVMIAGDYLGLLKPDEDYIAVAEDFSNLADVIDRLSDWDAAERMIASCHEKLVASDRFRYSRFVAEIMTTIADYAERKHVSLSATADFERLAAEHERESAKWADRRSRLARWGGALGFLGPLHPVVRAVYRGVKQFVPALRY